MRSTLKALPKINNLDELTCVSWKENRWAVCAYRHSLITLGQPIPDLVAEKYERLQKNRLDQWENHRRAGDIYANVLYLLYVNLIRCKDTANFLPLLQFAKELHLVNWVTLNPLEQSLTIIELCRLLTKLQPLPPTSR